MLTPYSSLRVAPRMEALEDRCTPAVGIRFDYSFDTSGFFSSADHRASLERAAADVTARMSDTLSAVTPSGGGTWSASVINGLTGQLVTVPNLSVNANEVVVYVVGGNLSNTELGLASGGAYSAQGSAGWLRTVRTRGQTGVDTGTDFAAWGGMIAFNSGANWNFSASGPSATQYDFQSVATHELLHLFGFGLGNPSFTRYTTSGAFNGPNTTAVYGSAVPLQAGGDSDHFAPGVSYGGQENVMGPAIRPGVTRRMTELDYAVLRDIGWAADAPAPTVPPAPTSPPASSAPGGVATPTLAVSPTPTLAVSPTPGGYAVSGGSSAFGYNASGQQVFNVSQLGPNFAGGTRVAVGDFNGDGTADYAVGAGPGALPEVKVFDGATGQLMADFMAYELGFAGGVYVAAGDITGNGRAELVLGAGAGGGPRVKVIDLTNFSVIADFWGIADADFRGGVRPAVGDIDGDGRADLVAAAGETGGPRLAVYDGTSLRDRLSPVRLAPDFYAFESSLTNGSYVAVGDINGDGMADLICGSGEGGGPRVVAYDGAALRSGRVVQVASFMAGDPNGTSGVRVAAADIDGDGFADILAGSGPNDGGILRGYVGRTAWNGAVPAQVKQASATDWVANGAFVG